MFILSSFLVLSDGLGISEKYQVPWLSGSSNADTQDGGDEIGQKFLVLDDCLKSVELTMKTVPRMTW